MTRIRFSLAQQVLDSVPDLGGEMTVPTGTLDPLAYLNQLIVGGKPDQAAAFCSFLLPRREAVQWLCNSVRSSGISLPVADEASLRLAEAWVKTPTETARKAAGEASNAGDKGQVGTWATLAVGWSGGNLTKDDEHPVPPPAHLTGVAVKVGQNLLSLAVPPSERPRHMENAVKSAVAMLKQEKA